MTIIRLLHKPGVNANSLGSKQPKVGQKTCTMQENGVTLNEKGDEMTDSDYEKYGEEESLQDEIARLRAAVENQELTIKFWKDQCDKQSEINGKLIAAMKRAGGNYEL
jgi:hypothetical protein